MASPAAHRQRQHTTGRWLTADQSLPPGLGVRSHKGADGQLTDDQQLTADQSLPSRLREGGHDGVAGFSPPTSVPPGGHSSPTSRSHPRLGAGGHNADDEQPTLDGSLLPADLSPPADGSESVKPQWRRRRRAGGEGAETRREKKKKDKRLTLTLAQGVAGALLDGMISSMVVTPKREAPIAVVVVVIREVGG